MGPRPYNTWSLGWLFYFFFVFLLNVGSYGIMSSLKWAVGSSHKWVCKISFFFFFSKVFQSFVVACMINKYLEFVTVTVSFTSTALMSLVIEKEKEYYSYNDQLQIWVLNLTTWPESYRLNQSEPVSQEDLFVLLQPPNYTEQLEGSLDQLVLWL